MTNIVVLYIFGDNLFQKRTRICTLLLISMLFIYTYMDNIHKTLILGHFVSLLLIIFSIITLNCLITKVERSVKKNIDDNFAIIRRTVFLSFFSNTFQKIWFDILFYSISFALFLPNFSCSWSKSIHSLTLLSNYQKSFVVWDITAILMSCGLAILYYIDFFKNNYDLIRYTDKTKSCNTNWGFPAFIILLVGISGLALILSFVRLFIYHDYFWMLLLLILAAACFLIIDIIYIIRASDKIKFLRSASSQGKNKQKEINEQISKLTKKIEEFKFSLTMGNIPATLGLVVLFVFWVEFMGTKSESIEGFIAGGSAMHIVFGNIIVGIALGGE